MNIILDRIWSTSFFFIIVFIIRKRNLSIEIRLNELDSVELNKISHVVSIHRFFSNEVHSAHIDRNSCWQYVKKSNILLIKRINVTFYKNFMWCKNTFKNIDLTLISYKKINIMLITTLKKSSFFNFSSRSLCLFWYIIYISYSFFDFLLDYCVLYIRFENIRFFVVLHSIVFIYRY